MIAELALAALLAQSPTTEQLLDNVRDAVHYEQFANSRGVQLKGGANYVGMETTFDFLFDTEGRYNFAVHGKAGQTRGWDGKTGWDADYSGATSKMYMEALEGQHAFSWALSYEWLREDGPYEVSIQRDLGNEYTINLKLKDGHLSQQLMVSTETWLPVYTTFNSTVGKHRIFFSDWKVTPHGAFPQLIETDDAGIEGRFKIEKISEMPVFIRSPFEMPNWSVDEDTVFDETKSGKIVTRRAPTGHVMVKPTLDSEDVGWFILDSGAGGMVLDTTVAKRIGAERFGEMNVGGVGGVSKSGYYQIDGFQLGPATVDGMLFVDYDLEGISQAFGVEIGGIVGYDFFRRVRLDIDLAGTEVSIFDPRVKVSDTIKWMELVLDNRHPTIEAEFEGGHTGRFRIDTGANGTMTFNRPTVVKHDLLKNRETRDARQGGVNGFVDSKSGNLEYFEMAGKRWNNINVIFSTSDEGLHGGTYLDGNLGQGLLREFRLILDYSNQRIAMIQKN